MSIVLMNVVNRRRYNAIQKRRSPARSAGPSSLSPADHHRVPCRSGADSNSSAAGVFVKACRATSNVDPRSGVPMYTQLIDQMKRSIAVGGARARRAPFQGEEQLRRRPYRQPDTPWPRVPRSSNATAFIETSPGRGRRPRGATSFKRATTVTDVAPSHSKPPIRDARSIASNSALEALVDRLIEPLVYPGRPSMIRSSIESLSKRRLRSKPSRDVSFEIRPDRFADCSGRTVRGNPTTFKCPHGVDAVRCGAFNPRASPRPTDVQRVAFVPERSALYDASTATSISR